MKELIISLLLVASCRIVLANDEYPKVKLDNGQLQALIYLPDANRGYYRGTRFDWSGIIGRVDYNGHQFYAPLRTVHDPEGHDSVSGPAEEFAMFNPMGFSEARKGESFVKIGVGLLEKDEKEDYHFYRRYRIIRAGKWEIEHESDWIDFIQDFKGERGWAYLYKKKIWLVPGHPELIIEHYLENRGEKTISVNHYNHNFTLIDNVPYGPEYIVEFPFSTDHPVSIKDIARYRDNRIEVIKPLENNALRITVFEGEDPGHYNAALVRNQSTGAAVEFHGDAPITRMVFWAVERAASPEPFTEIHLETGQAKQWTIRYRFLSDSQHKN